MRKLAIVSARYIFWTSGLDAASTYPGLDAEYNEHEDLFILELPSPRI